MTFSKKEKTVIMILSVICLFSVVLAATCTFAVNTPIPAIILDKAAYVDYMTTLTILPDISTIPPMSDLV